MVSFVSTYTIAPGVTYCVHPHHRNGTPHKSQWSIPESQERNVFIHARDQNWLLQTVGWGLHVVNGRVEYLGTTHNGTRCLFVAKFVDASENHTWHGYPADHQRRPSDIPSVCILQRWMTSNLLRRAVIRKIVRGQPCSL